MMNSPIENTDTAAAKDDHVIRTDPTDEITTADTQDMSLISGDHEKQRTSSTDDLEDLEQESDEDEQDHENQLDALHQACKKLPNQMSAIVDRLHLVMRRRPFFSGLDDWLSLNGKEICNVSETELNHLRRKWRFEKRFCESLGEVRAQYKDLNNIIQTSLETYPNLLANLSQTAKSADLKEATDALHHLETETTKFRQKIHGLLRTVFMSDKNAYSYMMDTQALSYAQYRAT